mmetsp:Transcript_111823/g.311186  ORF Transcript_111823/g.311186 Transcript_111823/m.311186 type:complete len:113 (-) Transcript_111823:435-773(-)
MVLYNTFWYPQRLEPTEGMQRWCQADGECTRRICHVLAAQRVALEDLACGFAVSMRALWRLNHNAAWASHAHDGGTPLGAGCGSGVCIVRIPYADSGESGCSRRAPASQFCN